MNGKRTLVRGTGLVIEAESVVAIQKGTNLTDKGMIETGVTCEFNGRSFVRFFLETNQILGWRAPNEEEADRVIGEIVAAKMGDPVMQRWIVTIEVRFYVDKENKWETETMELVVEAESRSQAMEKAKASLPGNVQERRYSVTDARPAGEIVDTVEEIG